MRKRRNWQRLVSEVRSVEYSATASIDLVALAEYVSRENGSSEAGRRVAHALDEKCRRLAALPATLGRARPEIGPDIRSFAFKSYVIFFRYDEAVFYVVNVLHSQRDIESYLRDHEGWPPRSSLRFRSHLDSAPSHMHIGHIAFDAVPRVLAA